MSDPTRQGIGLRRRIGAMLLATAALALTMSCMVPSSHSDDPKGTPTPPTSNSELPIVPTVTVVGWTPRPTMPPPTLTPTPTPTPQPGRGGCFGGALAADPIHCVALEWAHMHRDEVLKVEAVYGAGDQLYIYLVQTEPVSEEVYLHIQARALQETNRSGGDECEDPPMAVILECCAT